MKQVIAWTNKKIRKKLEKLNLKYNVPFLFVDTYNEFIKYLNNDVILFISMRKIYKDHKKLFDIVLKNQRRVFFIFRDLDINFSPIRINSFLREMNVITRYENDFYRLF